MNLFEEGAEIEKILGQIMKGQFSNVRENAQENNNSFIFLEKSSLNLLLAYLLSDTKKEAPDLVYEEFETLVLEQLDQAIHDNEEEFKVIINLLKEVT